MLMAFSLLWYSTFWSFMSIAFSIAAVYSLSSTAILHRNTIAYFLLLSVNSSISYALLYRPGLSLGQIGSSFASSFEQWKSSGAREITVLVWSFICISYLMAGIHCLYGDTVLTHYTTSFIFTMYNLFWVSSFRLHIPMIDVFRKGDNIDLDFLIHFITQNAPLIYFGKFLPYHDRIYEVVMFLEFPTVCSFLTALVNLITGSGYYFTRGRFSVGSLAPIEMYPFHFRCWIVIQFLFLVSMRVFKLHFLRASQTIGFISCSVIIPGFLLVCASLLESLLASSSVAVKVYEQRRMAVFIWGMFANAVAQYYIRVQSEDLLLGCLFMAVAWLGNIANVNPATDFGIFHFFVYAALQCAVTLYGLHFYTFLVAVVGSALMILRWKMQGISVVELVSVAEPNATKGYNRLEK